MASVLYSVDYETRVATITLNRPTRLNAIDHTMPSELAAAVDRANDDDGVHCIVLQGSGRAFCAGYDLQDFAQRKGTNSGVQAMPWDPTVDFKMMYANTQQFMKLWRSYKPTIAKVHGFAVAGGSDIALCCDLIVMEDNAKIGYPPARVWGVPSTFMWAHRLPVEHAKRLMFTGDLITGSEAARLGLVSAAVPRAQLDDAVAALASRIAAVPKNQLLLTKMVVNHAYDNQGLITTQALATLGDGIARHSPEGLWWKARAEAVGFKQAVLERDSGKPIAPGVATPSVVRSKL